MQPRLTFRVCFFIAGLVCLALLGIAYLLEYGFHLDPCPLCLLQRYLFWIMTFIFFLSSTHHCKTPGRYIYCGIIFILGVMGALLSARHIWLQHLPSDQTPACTAGLERMLRFQPLQEVLKTVLTSSGECAKVDFTILTFSLPAWTLLCFLGITSFSILLIILHKKRRI